MGRVHGGDGEPVSVVWRRVRSGGRIAVRHDAGADVGQKSRAPMLCLRSAPLRGVCANLNGKIGSVGISSLGFCVHYPGDGWRTTVAIPTYCAIAAPC